MVAGFKPIIVQANRLADEVYRQILLAISNGSISPSARIIQEKLASELQISRTPVREALLRLEQEGVLAIAGRGGFVLRKFSDRDVREIYSARQSIEGYSARVLAETGDPVALDRIEKVIRTEETRHISTAAASYEANKTIHRSFVQQTRNRYLLEMFDLMWNRSVSFHVFASTMGSDAFSTALKGHLDLLDTVRRGDGDAAERAMHTHIALGLELQLAELDHAR